MSWGFDMLVYVHTKHFRPTTVYFRMSTLLKMASMGAFWETVPLKPHSEIWRNFEILFILKMSGDE